MSVTAQCQPSTPVGRPPPKFKALFQSSLGLTIDALKDISPALIAREIGQTNGRIMHNKFGKLLIFYILNNLYCISQGFFPKLVYSTVNVSYLQAVLLRNL